MTHGTLSGDAIAAWHKLLAHSINRGHFGRKLEGPTVDEHAARCFASSLDLAGRMKQTMSGRTPFRILEMGSSTGLNCMALAQTFPQATVYGIEPEQEAIDVAAATAESWNIERTCFLKGVGEQLPFPDASFDLILCHTVIEHVVDVDRVIGEMARVLSPQGVISLQGPNYLWPREPHLQIWCVPFLGKPAIKLLAYLQGRSRTDAQFIDHLKLVSARGIEKSFARAGLRWEDRVREKIEAVAAGHVSEVKRYRFVIPLLRILKKLRLVEVFGRLVIALRLYPSMSYLLMRA